ncbi:MAG: serine/threonine protein kinase [Deltaproteobacteria bacterium]|nr:MAG: serine/threonine protein kinase [Deltaproteobacteria bacterium]
MSALPSPESERRSLRLESWLGAGSFADVYLGALRTPRREDRPVAIKLLGPTAMLSQACQRDLIGEAWVLRQLDGPGMVRIVELLRVEGQLALLTEFVPGRSLAPMPSTRACADAAGQVAHALATAPRGFLHRDIKLANLRLTPDGRVVLLDMGLAQIDGSGAGTNARLAGTLGYMAPECFTARPPTPAVDVYALGATLFALVTGHPLWGRRERRVARELRSFPRMHRAWRGIRLAEVTLPALAVLLDQMLDFDAARRPCAAEVAARLARMSLPGPSLRTVCASVAWPDEPQSIGARVLWEDPV